jgi:hypothetical protein
VYNKIITKLIISSLFLVTACLSTSSLAVCNNDGMIDPGEACDLGTLNNDDGSTGCKKDCTVAPNPTNATWNCTNDAAGYTTQQLVAATLFQSLFSRQTDPSLVKCIAGTSSTTAEVTFCNQYKQDIIKFKDLNSKISVKSVQTPQSLANVPCGANTLSTKFGGQHSFTFFNIFIQPTD